MRKLSLFRVDAALLGAALIFAGCETEAEENAVYQLIDYQYVATSLRYLNTALETYLRVAIKEDIEITINIIELVADNNSRTAGILTADGTNPIIAQSAVANNNLTIGGGYNYRAGRGKQNDRFSRGNNGDYGQKPC